MILMAGGGLFYASRMGAERRAATERVVSEALDEATLLRGQAKAAAVGDLSKWPGAIAAAKRARSLLATGERDSDLQKRVETLVALVTGEQAEAAHGAAELERDRKFLDRLERIRLERFEKGEKWDAKKTDDEYATAFREFGIDIDKLDPAEAGRLLKERSNPLELAFFLDDWGWVRYQALMNWDDGKPKDDSWRRLSAVARVTDPDLWRSSLRGLVGGNDHDTVNRMADDEKALVAQSARSLLLLSQVLEAQGDKARAEKVLKRAWEQSPDDFSICSQLARISAKEGVRFASIAVALRPENAWSHVALAEALLRLNDRTAPSDIGERPTLFNVYQRPGTNLDLHIDGVKKAYSNATRMNLTSQLKNDCVPQFRRRECGR